MDVLVIAHFTTLWEENGNSRFTYIAELLSNKDNVKVELITSNFFHIKKSHRLPLKPQINKPYKVTLLAEPQYRKNICLKRFYSHCMLGKQLKNYLKNRDRPDVIYCAVPSLDVACVASEYAKKYHIKFILDIQDLWPEAFQLVFHPPLISDMVFYPMKKKADKIYASADILVAVSQTYLNRGLMANTKCKSAHSVYLGTDLKQFDSFCGLSDRIQNKEGFSLAYVGTVGASYDLKTVVAALAEVRKRGILDVKFVVMGDGPQRKEVIDYAKKKQVSVEYSGILPYPEMVRRLARCDIAVNPLKTGAAQSIINKVGDYAAAGLPVINTLRTEEYWNLVDKYNIGFNVELKPETIAEKIEYLYKNYELRREMGRNNRKLAEELFDRGKNYDKIVELILK